MIVGKTMQNLIIQVREKDNYKYVVVDNENSKMILSILLSY